MSGGDNRQVTKAIDVVKDTSRAFIANVAWDARDIPGCVQEMRDLLTSLVTVLDSVPLHSFKDDHTVRHTIGRNVVLTTEERALLNDLLLSELKRYIVHAEEVQTNQAEELERNDGFVNDPVMRLERFRYFAIEKRAFALVKSFSTVIQMLANAAAEEPDKNRYLLSFDPETEQKKYAAAEIKTREDYVFYNLLLGDLFRHQATLIRAELPYENVSLDRTQMPQASKVERDRSIKGARQHYSQAFDFAKKQLSNTHPYTLRIGFSFATMYYDFLDEPRAAVELAQTIHREVAPRVLREIRNSEAAVRNQALPILQELEENLFLWTVVRPLDTQDPKCYDQMSLETLLQPFVAVEQRSLMKE